MNINSQFSLIPVPKQAAKSASKSSNSQVDNRFSVEPQENVLQVAEKAGQVAKRPRSFIESTKNNSTLEIKKVKADQSSPAIASAQQEKSVERTEVKLTSPKLTTMQYEGNAYMGETKDQIPHGFRTMTFPNGSQYVGNFIKGSRIGKGVVIGNQGEQVEGNDIDGRIVGQARIQSANQSIYEGPVENHLPHGQGKLRFLENKYPGDTDCAEYIGNFVAGVRTGKGFETRANGNTYEGDFLNNMWHGVGTFICKHAETYVGEYQNGKRTGKGLLIHVGGDKFEGDFQENAFIKGEVTYISGMHYSGTLKDGQFHGFGTLVFPTGEKYVGNFKMGKYHGVGKYYDLRGGCFCGTFNNGSKYTGYYI